MRDMEGYTNPYTQAMLRAINPERLDLLADALESGEYRKGENYLAQRPRSVPKRGEDGSWRMCCMGVGSEVAIANGLDIPSTIGGLPSAEIIGAEVKSYGHDWNISTFCAEVREWFGLPDNNPGIQQDNGLWRTMGTWNDKGQMTEEQARRRQHPADPEPDFTAIARGVRRLAAEAREAQRTWAEGTVRHA